MKKKTEADYTSVFFQILSEFVDRAEFALSPHALEVAKTVETAFYTTYEQMLDYGDCTDKDFATAILSVALTRMLKANMADVMDIVRRVESGELKMPATDSATGQKVN